MKVKSTLKSINARALVGFWLCIITISILTALAVRLGITDRQPKMTDRFEVLANQPIRICIPVVYELSMNMGLTSSKYTNMSITCYTNRVQETDSTPHHTASGRIVYEGSCAVSQDLYGPVLKRKLKDWTPGTGIWPGDILYIENMKRYFIVEDTMNVRHKKHVDLFLYKTNLKKAQEFGYKKSDVYVLRLHK